MFTVRDLEALRKSLQYALRKCDESLAGASPYDPSRDSLAGVLANLFEQGGNDLPLFEWFHALEGSTIMALIMNGATGPDLDLYTGLARATWKQRLSRKHRIAVAKVRKDSKPKK